MSALNKESRFFLGKFLHDPKRVGSVAPSSKYLARQMVAPVAWDDVEAVAELGAGTGAVTRYVAKRALPGTKVLLFEQDCAMRAMLARHFPAFAGEPDAADIAGALRRQGVDRLDCVLSCLPFFNFPKELRDRIMGQVSASLKPGGRFVAFQYSLQMKREIGSRFELEQIKFVPLNMPPAFVYVCRKR